MDILEKLADLRVQATKERSHHYVGSCVREAMTEIQQLRAAIAQIRIEQGYAIETIQPQYREAYEATR